MNKDTLTDKQKLERKLIMAKAEEKIYKAIQNLYPVESITILEGIKLDIMFNKPLVTIDGKIGSNSFKDIKEEKAKKVK